MTLGARHYFQTYHVCTSTLCRGAVRTSILITAAFAFALLLCAVFADQNNKQDMPTRPSLLAEVHPYISFLDSRFDFYFSRETYSKSYPSPPDYEQATAALSPLEGLSQLTAPNVTSSSPPNSLGVQHLAFNQRPSPQRILQSTALETSNRSTDGSESSTGGNTFQGFFAKLFAKLSSSPVRLASVATDDSQLDTVSTASRYDQWTAVYDISTHTVYMPDGGKLEAHSGFGASLDDPTRVAEKDTGPTPPDIYDLELRGQPFHGVRALRLVPEDDQKTLGRTGLLAHSFMLGPNGQSNGCVSFRDYDAFLRAYTNHQVKRLVVVASLD
jgi:Protein of unknown function (DUF2778)